MGAPGASGAGGALGARGVAGQGAAPQPSCSSGRSARSAHRCATQQIHICFPELLDSLQASAGSSFPARISSAPRQHPAQVPTNPWCLQPRQRSRKAAAARRDRLATQPWLRAPVQKPSIREKSEVSPGPECSLHTPFCAANILKILCRNLLSCGPQRVPTEPVCTSFGHGQPVLGSTKHGGTRWQII